MNMFFHYPQCWMIILVALQWFETPVYGQVFELGSCPSATAVSDFDVDAYLGKWYNNRNYFAFFQAKLDCITAVYGESGTVISVTNEGYNLITRKKSTVVGTGTIIAPGEIGVSFSGTPATSANYRVVGTDYINYAVVWNCSQLGPIRISFAWILTRASQPAQVVIDNALAVFNTFGIKTAPLKVTNQKNCPSG